MEFATENTSLEQRRTDQVVGDAELRAALRNGSRRSELSTGRHDDHRVTPGRELVPVLGGQPPDGRRKR
jgi:hypothetical protein